MAVVMEGIRWDRECYRCDWSKLSLPTLQAELDKHCCLQSFMVVAWAVESDLKILKSSSHLDEMLKC
jgi:hypothetical protein